MRTSTQNGLIIVVGVITTIAAINGLYLNYVKPALWIPLLLAAYVLILMGLYSIILGEGRSPTPPLGQDHEDDVGHSHHGGTRIGWLLVVPFFLLAAVGPSPLGAYSAVQDDGLVPVTSADDLPPLADGEIAEMSLWMFSSRALFDPGQSLENQRVRLVGFSSPGEDGSWVLTRMKLNCCAADGYAIKVAVSGAPDVPTNQWVEVIGSWVPGPLATG
ncbi:MAG: TIGR03943 family protein, partial [Ornithinimicrobium sp.]